MILLSFLVIALATVSAVNGGPCCLTRRHRLIPPFIVRPPYIIPTVIPPWVSKTKPYVPPRPVVAEISVMNGQTFGSWKDPEFCPFGTYASGFDLKVEKSQGGGVFWGNDDTALNAIALKCKDPKNDHYQGRDIKSGEGSYGKWKGLKECHKNGSTTYFLTAFQLRVEKKQSSWNKDDTAANNINFKCRSLTRSHNYVLAGAGMGWGSYGAWSAKCPEGSAICGLKTRVEGKQGSGDDTALNDVTFYCCKHPVAEDKATTKRTVKPTTIKPTRYTPRRVGIIGEIGQRGAMGSRGAAGAA